MGHGSAAINEATVTFGSCSHGRFEDDFPGCFDCCYAVHGTETLGSSIYLKARFQSEEHLSEVSLKK